MSENPDKNMDPGDQNNAYVADHVLEIPIQQIKVADFGHRTVEENLTALTESIQRHGLLHFPTVVPDPNNKNGYILIAGRKRLAAVKELGWDRISCHVRSLDEYEGRFISFIENSQRKNPHPIDQARDLFAIQQLTNMSEKQIGKEIGLSQESVSEHIGIRELPEDIQQMIGTEPESPIKYSHAVRLTRLMRTKRLHRELEVRKLANKTASCNLSSGELGAHVAFIKSGKFDSLTGRLKDPFWEDKWMSPFLGKLFLYPQDKDFILDTVSNAEALRKKAGRLEPKQLERFVLNAVERRWTEEEIKNNFASYVEAMLPDTQDDNPKEQPDFLEKLASEISSLLNRLVEADYKIPPIAESQSHRLLVLRDLAARLNDELERFAKKVEQITEEDVL